jgi:hypothetical protein
VSREGEAVVAVPPIQVEHAAQQYEIFVPPPCSPSRSVARRTVVQQLARAAEVAKLATRLSARLELELELIQTHMAQKPLLRVDVCARCVARESKSIKG